MYIIAGFDLEKKPDSIQEAGINQYLIVGIPEVIDGSGLPELSEPEEPARPEPVFSHDDEVSEEAGGSLNEAKLRRKYITYFNIIQND
jgi:hypothetical protein